VRRVRHSEPGTTALMSESTYEQDVPGDPHFAGGGGPEPDLDQAAEDRPTPSPGGGVDLKSEDLPEPDGE